MGRCCSNRGANASRFDGVACTRQLRVRPRSRMPTDRLIGSLIDGRFEILEEIGHGGMGSVYRAYQRSVKRDVAIKLIKPSRSQGPMSVRRFEREARVARQLSP